jgi:hypothetical protein
MNTKTSLLSFVFLVMMTICSFSQYTPKGMSYQAVARDEKGFELKNKELEVRISIIPADPNSTSEYTESHNIITDKYGLFSLIIGQGSYISGTASDFSMINWGSGVHFLKVEVDFGAGFKSMGTTQFLAVPYALYAGTASNAPGAKDEQQLSYDPVKQVLSLENGGNADLSGLFADSDADPTNEIQDLSYSNHVLTLSKANSVTINVDDADADPKNELQNLSIDGHKLSISGGNDITLPDLVEDADHDTLNEIQSLSYADGRLSLSKSNSVTINMNDADADPTNELQNLSIDGHKLSISGGNDITIPDMVEDADHDTLNEIQSLSYSDGKLSLSKSNSVTINVNDADADPTNELQNLSLDGYKLSLSNGNSVTLTDLYEDADHDSINEIQDLHFDEVSNILSITKNPTASPIYLQKYLDNTDNQTLLITGDSLGIFQGNKVGIDVSKTNEIQTLSRSGNKIILSLNGGEVVDNVDDADNNPANELQSPKLTGDNLSLTNDPNNITVDLSKYKDNTDDQMLSKSGYNLSIESGNTINIRPKIIGFRALKSLETSKILYAGDSTFLVFPNEKLDSGNIYNKYNDGKFIVPIGGEGLYHFDLVYQNISGHSLRIYINGALYEQVLPVDNYPFIVYLNDGETVEILLKSSILSNPQAGTFSGYRIH